MIARAVRFIRREVFRDPFLLEVKRWFDAKGDTTLRLDYPLDADSIVFDVGGYKGDFAAAVHSRYGCQVHIFEPLQRYYDECVERFAGNPKIVCHRYGLGAADTMLDISENADASSFVAGRPGDSTKCEIRSVADVTAALGISRIDLLKLNIEGGEFEVLPALLDAVIMERVRFVQVQFHNFVPDAVDRRAEIRRRLGATHDEMWNFEFVWESWACR
jgi:FkbM family methyltransferase